jgi:CRISPR-associated protein (TIGR03986 family)
MNPKHHNPTKKRCDRRENEFWAHAPYNFVPLPEKVVPLDADKIPGHDVYTGHTGYISCMLETRSPLYTRCAVDPEFFRQYGDKPFYELPEDQKNKFAHCFSLDNAEIPLIPGSSLRGMVRTLVEIASFSKVQPVTSQPLVYRAVGDTSSLGEGYRGRLLHEVDHRTYEFKMRAGYIRKLGGLWVIVPARSLNGAAFARVEQSDIPDNLPKWHHARNAFQAYVALVRSKKYSHANGRVHLCYVKVSKVELNIASGLQQAIVVKTGLMGRKHQEFVFGMPETDPKKAVPIEQVLVDAYKDQLTESQQELLGDDGVLQDWQPVFYLMENDKLAFFGHAMMFRLPYLSTPKNMLPEVLRDGTQTDLAEALFGYVEKTKCNSRPVARAGRLFFGDARFESAQNGIWISENPITPKVLGSPKPTTFQHYLVQDKSKGHDPNVKQQLAHYDTSIQETTIRGHKFYWHMDNVNLNEVREEPKKIAKSPKQHTRIKPVNSGVTFCFRIYFESLCDFELGALIWALTLPGEADKDYCHSLGMGKALGLGAVKITPTLYLSDRTARYTELFAGSNWNLGEKQESNLQQFVRAFETFVIEGLDSRERGQARSLKEVERIKMLLKMMEWPGPDRSLTEYMTIEPNEYKERPVLPDPLHINEPTGSGPSTMQRSRRDRGDYWQDNRRGRR